MNRVSFLIILILFFLSIVLVAIFPKQDGRILVDELEELPVQELTAHEMMLERTQPQRQTNGGVVIERGADINRHHNTYRKADDVIDSYVDVIRGRGYRCDSITSFSLMIYEVTNRDKLASWLRAMDARAPVAERPETHDTMVDTVVKCNKGRDEYKTQFNMDSKEIQVTRNDAYSWR